MYDLGVAICSLAHSKGGRLIERMTVEIERQSRDGATAEAMNHLAKLNQATYKGRNIVIGEFVTVHSQDNTLGAFHVANLDI